MCDCDCEKGITDGDVGIDDRWGSGGNGEGGTMDEPVARSGRTWSGVDVIMKVPAVAAVDMVCECSSVVLCRKGVDCE